MKNLLFTIVDEKAHCINAVFLAVSEDVARRMVHSSFAGGDSLIRRYPADFALVRLGDIDCSSGAIIALQVPQLVCKLDELFHED